MGFVYERGRGYRARILLDSVGPSGKRITTWELRYPRMVHAELITHRVLSRSSASSRAIPNEKLIAQVVEDPAMPVWWGKNQTGMQARATLSPEPSPTCRECGLVPTQIESVLCEAWALVSHPVRGGGHDFRSEEQVAVDAWLAGRDRAVALSRELTACGLHKQIANRVIEPWMFITVIVTATEWDNWYALRDHPDAQPEIAYVARMMREAWDVSSPRKLDEGDWHLPLVAGIDHVNFPYEYDIVDLKWISAGRCARVSYLTHEGRRDPQADIDLAKKLAASSPGHWSPFEHVARALGAPLQSGNFYGWAQFRKEFANEHVGGARP